MSSAFAGKPRPSPRLHHPHIVQIFEVGEADGVPYMALEYVSGGTLAHRLREHPLSPKEAAELTETLARALDVAHQTGIIHRDLKPANILLSGVGSQESGVGEEGRPSPLMAPHVKIADFGLAKRIGRPPFKESTLFETLAQVCTRDPIAPSKLLLRMPRDLEAVCLKCLEKDPQKRYPSAAALADDLRRWQDGKPTLARPLGPVSRSWKLVRCNPVISTAAVVASAALVAGAIVAGWYQLKAIRANGDQEAMGIRLRAEAAAREAEVREHTLAEERAEVGRRANYSRLLGVADRFWQGNSPTLADEALDDCPRDLRAWEWHFRRQRIHGSPLPAFRACFSDVGAVAVSFDGTLLATGAGDPDDPDNQEKPAVVQLWDIATGRRLAEFKDHTGPVTTVAFSRDGKTLVSASRRIDIRGLALSQLPAFHDVQGEVIAWDVATRKQRFTLDGVAGPIALSADGTRLAACAAGRLARMWDITDEKWVELPALPAYSGRVVALALSPDGKKLAISGIDITSIESGRPVGPETFAVYEVTAGRKIPTSPEYRDTVVSVIFAPDGGTLFAACLGGVVRQWDLTTGRQGQQLRGHNNTVTAMAFSRDGRRLATASLDQAVKLWEPKEGVELRTYRGHDRVATSVAFGQPSDSSELLVSAGADGIVREWDARRDPDGMELRGHQGLIHAVAFSPDQPLLASVSTLKAEAHVWDVSTGKAVAVLPVRAERLAFGPDGLLATAGGFPADKPGELLLWDVSKQSVRYVLAGHKRFVTAVAFSRDGRWLASAGGNPLTEEAEDVCIWNVATGKEQLRFRPSVGMVRALAFSPDGQHLAIGGLEGAVVVCDRDTGRELKRFINDPGSVYTVAYAPDGKTIASGDKGGFVTIWEAVSGRELLRVRGHVGAVSAVSFDDTGRRLATASFDLLNTGRGEVRLWDTYDGREVLELPGETFVAFSSDGRRLAAVERRLKFPSTDN